MTDWHMQFIDSAGARGRSGVWDEKQLVRYLTEEHTIKIAVLHGAIHVTRKVNMGNLPTTTITRVFTPILKEDT